MTQNNTTKKHGVDFVDTFILAANIDSLQSRVTALEEVVEVLQAQEKRSKKVNKDAEG